MPSRFSVHSHLPEKTFLHLLHGFVMDLDATRLAQVLNVNRNTVNRYFHLLRARIAERWNPGMPPDGQASPYFGIMAEEDCIRVFPVDSYDGLTADILAGRREDASLLDGRGRPLTAILDLQTKQQCILRAASAAPDIALTEEFLAFAWQRLARFRGLQAPTLHLHLAETAWRFNHRDGDLFELLLVCFREKPLKAYA